MLTPGIMEVDVHGMNQFQAKTYIDAQLKRVKSNVYQMRVIHGYHNGTVLRDMIRFTYKKNPKVIRLEQGCNPGETFLILREL